VGDGGENAASSGKIFVEKTGELMVTEKEMRQGSQPLPLAGDEEKEGKRGGDIQII